MKKEDRKVLNTIRQSIDHLNNYHMNDRQLGDFDEDDTQFIYNRSAKEHKALLHKQFDAEIAVLEKAFKLSTETTIPLYRGAQEFDLATPRNRYVSATADKSIADSYSKGVLIKILPGAKALDFDKMIGHEDGVRHFLFDRGQKFEVVEKDDKMITVKAV